MIDLKKSAQQVFLETLAAIDIPNIMRRKLARDKSRIFVNHKGFDLTRYSRIYGVAIGKAANAMAQGLSQTLVPEFAATGIIVTSSDPDNPPPGFDVIVAGHPIPNENSFAAGRAILELLKTVDERTLIFFLLSGGGSALVEQPIFPAVDLAAIQQMNRLLVHCGASIDEINAVRKHVSAVKGGRLAVAAGKAMKITLGITDVPEGRESALASGPTLPDPTTVADATRVIARYGLLPTLPSAICNAFEHPESIPETPKADNPAFERAIFQLVLDRHTIFHSAHRCTEAAGCITICDNTTDDWPLERAADFLLTQLAALKHENPGRPVAIIADGEVSSPVTANGIGGRNSAFVLRCVEKIAGRQIAVLSAGTDGIDGSSPAAGAVADGSSLSRAMALGMNPNDYFIRSDSYSFFKQLGDAIVTGPTGNNLRDLRVLLAR